MTQDFQKIRNAECGNYTHIMPCSLGTVLPVELAPQMIIESNEDRTRVRLIRIQIVHRSNLVDVAVAMLGRSL